MAEDLAEPLPGSATRAPAEPRRRMAFRGRFLAAYLVLGLLAGAGLAAAFVLFTTADRNAGSDWSEWRPVGEGATFPQQIADHVARRYRLASGDQIVGVVAGPPKVSNTKVSAVAIQAPNATSSDDIKILPADRTYMYLLCGLGDSCSIGSGKPSEERHRLLRREALELALYSFRYMGVDSVIALLPPPAGANAQATALFLEKKYFQDELGQPLDQTIGNPEAQSVVAVPELETVRIDRLTMPFLFTYSFQALQDQNAILVLSPIDNEG